MMRIFTISIFAVLLFCSSSLVVWGQNTEECKEFYPSREKLKKSATEKKDTKAQFCLGLISKVKSNYTEAVKWYRMAAVQGHALAQYNLGWMYVLGKGVSQDYTEAVKWYRMAAVQGHDFVQYSLGSMYFLGKGVSQDYTEAVKWYRMAAVQGDYRAQNSLGSMYYEGKGVLQDYKEAVKWYRMAAVQGDSFAQYNLGDIYYEGKAVPRNYIEAYKWFNIASYNKNGHATERRNKLVKIMTSSQIAEAQRLSSECVKSYYRKCE